MGRKELAGAVSLNSANMNLSRVIGPAIGGVIYAKVGASWAFVTNAASYLVLIGVLATRAAAGRCAGSTGQGWRRLLDGFAVARRDRVVGRCLTTMVLFSFFCLPIAVLMPVLAHNDLGIGEDTIAYGLLYACFGAGAVVGALSIGTFLAGQRLERVVRFGLGGFALALATFGLLRQPRARLPGRLPGRPVLLRHGDLARHRAPATAGRRGARPGHGPVGHGLRRDGPARGHRRRAAQPAFRHRHGGGGRRGGRRRPGPAGRPGGPGPRSRAGRLETEGLIDADPARRPCRHGSPGHRVTAAPVSGPCPEPPGTVAAPGRWSGEGGRADGVGFLD